MKQPRLWTRNYISILIANGLTFTSFYYLLVTLPIFGLQDLDTNKTQVGLFTTMFLISAIVIRPFAGKWLEKTGKYAIFISSLLILCAASLLYLLPGSFTSLLVIRFIHGVGFGMATTANGAIVADLIPESRKGEGMGYYGLTLNLGMVIGPFLGLTVINAGGTTVMFIINAVVSLLAIVTGVFVRLPKKANVTVNKTEANNVKGLKGLLEPSGVPISLIAAFLALVYSAIVSFVAVYAIEQGFVEASSYFFVVYAVILLASRPFTGKWFDLYGANYIIYPAILCFAIGTFLLASSTSSWIFLVSALLIGLGWGTVFPSLQTIAIQVAEPERRSAATAGFLSIFDFGFGIGSFVFGLVAAQIGYKSLYFYSSFLVLIGIIVYYFLHGRKVSSQQN
ncbi:MFS transporter [Priestia megaterium]|uniref:MFS transporter n=1 Tax=Priestia megaterium TaxID=1404 RepID=UPI002041E075|nr:MFS transporter [Priestia megaterium]MCM3196805.1 MFS transporter [Priestia megaterium]